MLIEITFDVSDKLFFNTIELECKGCGDFTKNRLVNTIDRIVNDLPYTENNIQSLCIPCNFMKKAMTMNQYISRCIKVASFQADKGDYHSKV